MKLILSGKNYLLALKFLFFCAIVLMGILVLLVVLPFQMPFKAFIVLSDSMSPAISAGSMVLVQRQISLFQKGDIITFIHPTNPLDYVTHRIIDVKNEGNIFSYQTKGDANTPADPWLVKKEAVWGKAIFTLPYLGYLINFSRSKLGLILTIVLPLLFIAATEIMVIVREFKRLRNAGLKIPRI